MGQDREQTGINESVDGRGSVGEQIEVGKEVRRVPWGSRAGPLAATRC